MSQADQPSGKPSAINIVFVGFMAVAILFAGYTGKMEEVTQASLDSAKTAVNLAIDLIGVMALWLGLVRVLEAGGLMYTLANILKPLMVKLFPDVPPTHPAMGAMILNISANMLGLGNAATPFGIKAMVELNKLNPLKGTATNAMCLFLAINTSSVVLFPLGVIGVRVAANSSNPAAIFLPTLLATLCSTVVGISVASWLGRKDSSFQEVESLTEPSPEELEIESSDNRVEEVEEADYSHLLYPTGRASQMIAWLFILGFSGTIIYGVIRSDTLGDFFNQDFISHWLMPILILLIITYGVGRGVKVYEAVTEGAKQGFDIAIRIIPFLVAILVAIGMFRASGAMEAVSNLLSPITNLIGMPAEVLPMALLRPLSGGGAFGIMSELVERSPDSYSAFVASTMMGSTDTTFYVLAVYFGAVGITRIRHALAAGLLADATGLLSACIFSSLFWMG
ncbi:MULTISPECIES: nucleoside recognition domain-containing protein [unclassified Roseofilum]|uniref:nucleoside recognition domain-containing protein n=1 Tax=unclassified Roseofilum TaxID=2620099 RepID=UPI001B2419A5|nr:MULTISPECIES: nucleoside recognition domain-containing protein [unclassified Roseofilum]MBP0010940.1 spore maturation protein [Roseofilum sp. Belize Diploria]MBP0033892.1 spore maturation protein [Roseofilum sp. Belize BBD 4]